MLSWLICNEILITFNSHMGADSDESLTDMMPQAATECTFIHVILVYVYSMCASHVTSCNIGKTHNAVPSADASVSLSV